MRMQEISSNTDKTAAEIKKIFKNKDFSEIVLEIKLLFQSELLNSDLDNASTPKSKLKVIENFLKNQYPAVYSEITNSNKCIFGDWGDFSVLGAIN